MSIVSKLAGAKNTEASATKNDSASAESGTETKTVKLKGTVYIADKLLELSIKGFTKEHVNDVPYAFILPNKSEVDASGFVKHGVVEGSITRSDLVYWLFNEAGENFSDGTKNEYYHDREAVTRVLRAYEGGEVRYQTVQGICKVYGQVKCPRILANTAARAAAAEEAKAKREEAKAKKIADAAEAAKKAAETAAATAAAKAKAKT